MEFTYNPSDTTAVYRVLFINRIDECLSRLHIIMKKYKRLAFFYDANLISAQVKLITSLFPNEQTIPVAINTDKKDIKRVELIWSSLTEQVSDIAIVIGGGTLSDLSGFACSTYQRGIPRIVFSTTLLAMVDATIGGKTGIDFKSIKNAIGTMHYPLLTVNYPPLLDTLSDAEFASGYSEVIKVAVLQDAALFNKLTKLNNSRSVNLGLLSASARLKATICEEGSEKKLKLLYGHAVGHALEKCTKTKLRHGDAVAIGMNIEGAISCILGIWNKQEWKAQLRLLQKLSLPTKIPRGITTSMVLQKMKKYKKLVGTDSYYLILPKKIGLPMMTGQSYLTPIRQDRMAGLLENAIKMSEDICVE